MIDSKNYEFLSTYESDYSSDEDSLSDYSDIKSKLPDKLPDNYKANVISVYNTGEDLIIDEDTVQNETFQIIFQTTKQQITKNKLIPELM